MKILSKTIVLTLAFSVALGISACSKNTTEALDTTTTTSINDDMAIYYVNVEKNNILDTEIMEVYVDCNYFAAVDGSSMKLEIINPDDNVIYENDSQFNSGSSQSIDISASDCNLDYFGAGDYIIKVSNSYNSHVAQEIISVTPTVEPLISAPEADLLGYYDETSYTNEYFGVKVNFPEEYMLYDPTDFEEGSIGGYSVAYYGDKAESSFDFLVMVGHITDGSTAEIKDLLSYNTFTNDPARASVVTINNLKYLKFDVDGTTILMSIKNSNIIVFAMSNFENGEGYMNNLMSSIKPI